MIRCLLLLTLLSVGCQSTPPAPKAATAPRPWQVHFSPKGGCTAAVIEAIGEAQQTILVQAYSFSSEPITAALIAAHKRGVKVSVILDSSDAAGSSRPFGIRLVDAGIPVALDAAHAIAHNKVMILDGKTVITGSFNFSHQAEVGNAENLLVIRSPALAAKYEANWQHHRQHSTPWRP